MLTRRMWLVLSLISLASFIGIIIIIYKCTVWDSYLAWPACAATLITSMGCCYLCTYMPLRYNYDKPEKPRRIKGFEVFSLVFSSFSKPKNHTEISRIIGGVSLTTNE